MNTETKLQSKTLDYFYVGCDRQIEGRTILYYPISPNYRTREEAAQFLASCGVIMARLIAASFDVSDDTEAARMEEEIFGRAVQHNYCH